MPIDSGPIIAGPVSRIGASDGRAFRVATNDANLPTATASAEATFKPSAALDPGQPPVDVERVAMIRKAVEAGTYPVIPAKIADAMIANGILLRSPQ